MVGKRSGRGGASGPTAEGGGDTRGPRDDQDDLDVDSDGGGTTGLDTESDTLAGNYHLTDEDIEDEIELDSDDAIMVPNLGQSRPHKNN